MLLSGQYPYQHISDSLVASYRSACFMRYDETMQVVECFMIGANFHRLL